MRSDAAHPFASHFRRWARPLEQFIGIEASAGVVLLAATFVALVWANSSWSSSYDGVWHAPISIGVGGWAIGQTLHFWINEGLMVVFFFVVGLEIRRELYAGELADARRAALPVAAAMGGMIAPALVYLAVNHAPGVRRGWGVPMATDIAFAVGVLALLGKRVPRALRILLLALAIIDDIGAILVIAIFYSSSISLAGLLVAAGGVGGVLALQRFGVRRALVYVLPGVIVWVGLLRGGVHPTIAGVILGLLTPVREGPASPAARLEAKLHPWVAFVIMPLFALANAGVTVRGLGLTAETRTILLGVFLGLVVGKPLGIVVAGAASVKLGLAALPRGVGWGGLLLVGAVAGIGFTMAIFVSGLAFDDAGMLSAAKLGVLGASLAAGVIGLTLGRRILRTPS